MTAEAEAAFGLDSGSGNWAVEWPILTRMKRVYADTGVIVAVVMGPSDVHYEEAVEFFKAAARAGAIVVVSHLTLAEAIDVVRKRTKMRRRYGDGSERERAEIHAAAAAAVVDIDGFVDTGCSLQRMEILEDQASVTVDFKMLAEEIRRQVGRTPEAQRGNTYRHEAVGPIDLLHLLLARLAKAQVVCTTDKALAQLRDDPRYAGMEFILLSPRPAAARER